MSKFRIGDHVRKVRGFFNIGMTGVVQGFVDCWFPSDPYSMMIRSDVAGLALKCFTNPPEVSGAVPAGSILCANPDEWEKINPWEALDEESIAEELEEDHVVCR